MSRQWGDPDRWLIAKGYKVWDIFPPALDGQDTSVPAATFKTGAEAIAAFAFPTGEAHAAPERYATGAYTKALGAYTATERYGAIG